MLRNHNALWAMIILAWANGPTAAWSATASNILQQGKLIDTNNTATQLNALIDGDTDTLTEPLTEPVEYIFSFDNVVTVERLIVHLQPTNSAGPVAEVELLGSLASSDSGYKVLRSQTLNGNRAQHSLKFLPAGVQWLMLRITPNAESAESAKPTGAAITELEVSGRPGPPSTTYAFRESPTDSLAVLQTLRSTVDVGISADEQSLIEDAADGKLDQWSLADAALLASGITDSATRQGYNTAIKALMLSAKQALPQSDDVLNQGQALLEWLHREPMHANYVSAQTDLSVLLDTGTYNCVSSAVLYSIVGSAVGLDVRGIEVPDHAFAIVYDGTQHADVETTTVGGFNPARSATAAAAFTDRTGFSYIPNSNVAQRRETSALGLIALIYYNHGVTYSKNGQHLAALLSYFRALSLDPGAKSAVKNALSALANWTAQLSAAGDYDKALTVLNVGLTLAPKDRTLLHNRRVVWQNRINHATTNNADTERLIELVNQAHAADPKGGFERQQANVFLRQGRVLVETSKWQEALELAVQGKGLVNTASQKTLDRFITNVVLRWFGQAVDDKRWPAALSSLTQGLELNPKSYRFKQNMAYLLQEWSEWAATTQDPTAAITAVDQILQDHGDIPSVQRAARSFVGRRLETYKDQGDFAGALVALERYQSILASDREHDKLVLSVFSSQAQAHIDKRDWPAAATIYENARAQFPDNSEIKRVYQRNGAYIAQEWLADTAAAGTSVDALAKALLSRFQDINAVPRTVSTHYQHRVQTLQQTGNHEAAAKLARDVNKAIPDPKISKDVIRFAYDGWAQFHSDNKDWQKAVDIYQQALELAPNDSRLKNNAVATWHAWAQPQLDAQQWQQAIAIYQRGLEYLPNTGLFKQNIRYCQSKIDSGG